MQLTRFDRWLREKFTQETHILTMRPAAVLPASVRAYQMPQGSGQVYQHRYVTRSERSARDLIRILQEHNQMYATQVVSRKVWYARFIAPEGRSFTWQLFSRILIGIGTASLVTWLLKLWSNPELRAHFVDAFNLFFRSK